jgi:hypothetical protein
MKRGKLPFPLRPALAISVCSAPFAAVQTNGTVPQQWSFIGRGGKCLGRAESSRSPGLDERRARANPPTHAKLVHPVVDIKDSFGLEFFVARPLTRTVLAMHTVEEKPIGMPNTRALP